MIVECNEISPLLSTGGGKEVHLQLDEEHSGRKWQHRHALQ
jgi:hypothetical protein